MMFHPKRPKAPKMGVKVVESRVSQKHRKFVRGHACIVPRCQRRDVQFAHIRSGLPAGEAPGTGLKSHDVFGFPACAFHHGEQHGIGEESFAQKYGVDLLAKALWLSERSTDLGIRAKVAALRAAGAI